MPRMSSGGVVALVTPTPKASIVSRPPDKTWLPFLSVHVAALSVVAQTPPSPPRYSVPSGAKASAWTSGWTGPDTELHVHTPPLELASKTCEVAKKSRFGLVGLTAMARASAKNPMSYESNTAVGLGAMSVQLAPASVVW